MAPSAAADIACASSGLPGLSVRRDTPPGVRWRVLHTRSRQEKAVASLLEAAGVEHYLPLIEKIRVYRRSKRIVQAPLFACYVFVRGTREEAFFGSSTGRVARVIESDDQERLESELGSLRRALEVERTLDPYPFLTKGRLVRVTAGPLRGVEGLVDMYQQPRRLVLQIQTLGQAASLEIDPSLLEPVDAFSDA